MGVLDFLTAVRGQARPDLPPGHKLATIDPAYTVGSLNDVTLPKVTFDGETTMSTKRYPIVDGYIPSPSQRVLLVPVGRTYVIVGAVSHANAHNGPARCKVYLTTGNAVDNAFTNIAWDANATTDYEQPTSGLFHSHVTNPSRITIPTGHGGLYDVTWKVGFAANGTGVRIANLLRNGSTVAESPIPVPNAIFPCVIGCTVPLELSDGDYLEASYFQNSGGPLAFQTGVGGTFLSIIRRAPFG
jgi:hypothetical protein